MESNTSNKSPQLIASFDYSFKIEVYIPVFEPLASISVIDTKILAKGTHTIEIGHMNGGCCRKLVYAIVKEGMVTSIEAEECKDDKEEASEEIKELFQFALKLPELQDSWEPLPVKKFITMAQKGSYPPRAGTGAGCFYICIGHWCLFCCTPRPSRSSLCMFERRKPDVIMDI